MNLQIEQRCRPTQDAPPASTSSPLHESYEGKVQQFHQLNSTKIAVPPRLCETSFESWVFHLKIKPPLSMTPQVTILSSKALGVLGQPRGWSSTDQRIPISRQQTLNSPVALLIICKSSTALAFRLPRISPRHLCPVSRNVEYQTSITRVDINKRPRPIQR